MTTILCVGNFGSGNEGQKKVAQLLEYLHNLYECRFIIGLGNSIMSEGVASSIDPQFSEKFEEPYKNILGKMKFYNLPGYMDYYTRKSLNSEIKYSGINKNWVLPHNFYCFKKMINRVPVEFIMIDSNFSKLRNKNMQEKWAINTLLESRSRWNIVVSHHPWYSNNKNYECSEELDNLFNKMNNTGKIDLFISGYDYTQQHIYIPKKPNIIISGVGSCSKNLPIIKIYKEIKYISNKLGCCMIDFTKTKLVVSFYNIYKKREYNFSVHKV
jgi:tartrate-resistant acid phosphatase type 5